MLVMDAMLGRHMAQLKMPREVDEKLGDPTPLELLLHGGLASLIDPACLEHVLCQVECCSLHRQRGSLNGVAVEWRGRHRKPRARCAS